MTAGLWLHKPCKNHGVIDGHWNEATDSYCHPNQARLDPEQVVFPSWVVSDAADAEVDITVADIIDALDQEEE